MNESSLFERLLVIANYVTFGLVGFIYLIINAIRHENLSPFLQYHIFQSFFLVMLYWLIGTFFSLLMYILSFIPFINILMLKIAFYFSVPLLFGRYSIISGSVALIVFYLVFTSLQGMYSYIPWVSDIISRTVRR